MINKINRITAFTLVFLMLFALLPAAGAAQAITMEEFVQGAEVLIQYADTELDWLLISGDAENLRYTYFKYENANGEVEYHPAFCIDPPLSGAHAAVRVFGSDRTEDGRPGAKWIVDGPVTDDNFFGIMMSGYPHNKMETWGLQSMEEAYYATKIALWMYIMNLSPGDITTNPVANQIVASRVLSAALQIYSVGMTFYTNYLTNYGEPWKPAEITIDGGGRMDKDSSQVYWEQTLMVKWNGWIGNNPSASEELSVEWENGVPPLTGLQILLNDTVDIKSTMRIPTDEVFPREATLTVRIPVDGNPDTFDLGNLVVTASAMETNNLYTSHYHRTEVTGQRYIVEGERKEPKSANVVILFGEDEPSPSPSPSPSGGGSASGKIRKVRYGTTEPLAGAVIRITQRSPEVRHIGDFVTNNSGSIDMELEPGEYDLEEITPPDGFVLDENSFKRLTVVEGQAFEVVFANKPRQDIEILKIDGDTGRPLVGVTMRIALDGGSEAYEGVTDASGKFSVPKLQDGTWFVTENATLPGYIRDTSTRTVRVTAGEPSPKTVVFQNFKPTFLKVDGDSGQPLAGAELAIYRVGGGLVYQGVTGADGQLSNLPPFEEGAYEIVEILAPEGYLKDPTHRVVEFKADGSGARQVKFDNFKKPWITIYKVDAQNQLAGIAGVVFRVTCPNAQEMDYATDANGEIKVENLDLGIYIVREISAPAPYIIDPIPRRVAVYTGDKEVPVWFVNYPEPGFKLFKIDSQTKAPLAGVRFSVRGLDSANSHINLDGITTDANGIIDIDHLPEGTYEFTEMLAPEGYIVDSCPQIFELKRSQNPAQDTKIMFSNTPLPTFELIKYDAKTGLPLPGATFSITRIVDGGRYLDRVTDANGRILISGTELAYFLNKPITSVTLDDFRNGIVLSVVETHAPEGYLRDWTEYHVQLFPGQKSTLIVNNYQMSDLEIVKVDMKTREPVPGAKFTIEMADGMTITDAITDENGRILLSEWYDGKPLTPGVYKVMEVSVPHPFILDPIPRYITLVPNRVNTLVFDNWKMERIHVLKYDMDTAEPLANAEFSVKVKGSEIILGEGLTDSNGVYVGPYLAPGWYTVTEMAPPPGYLNSEPSSRDIYVIPGQEIVVKFDNKKKPGLYVYKYDELTATPLADTEFSIARRDGPVVYEGLTNDSGYIYLEEYEDGYYIITEMAPPPSYLNSNTPSREVYLEAGKVLTVKFDNVRKPVLIFQKTNGLTGLGVSGATFKVEYEQPTGGVVTLGSFKTDANGRIIIPKVTPGWYILTETMPAQGFSLPSNPVTRMYVSAGQNAYLSEFEHYYTGSGSGSDGEIITLTSGIAEEHSGSEYVQGESYNWPLNSLVIKKTHAITGELLAGAAFELYRADEQTSGVPGTAIGRYTTDHSGIVVITGLEAGYYIVKEVQAPANFLLSENSQQHGLLKTDGTSVLEFTFANYPFGGLLISKIDAATGELLAGARFKVADSSGAVVGNTNGEYTTDRNGEIHIPNVKPGSYIVTELQAPAGYTLDAQPQTISIAADGKTYTLTFANSKLSSAQIIKIDAESKQPLKGAKFTIYKANGKIVGTYETNGDGVIILPQLQSGWYKAAETKAPSGYQIDDTPQDFEITSNQFVKLVFENKLLPGVSILKIDAETRRPLAGAKYLVTKSNGAPAELARWGGSGERIGEFTTNNQGLIPLTDLDPGHYIATETLAPRGYIINPEPVPFEIAAGEVLTLTFENRAESSILLKKIDSMTGKGIYGVTFLISDSGDNPIATETTDQNGYLYLTGLRDGKYYIREIEPAAGYVPDTTIKTFYIEYGTTEVITWRNTPNMGQVQVTKKSADANPTNGFPAGTYLEGAVFELYTRAGNLVDTFKTDKNGKGYSKPIAPGRYVLREVQAPAYYEKLTEPIDVEIEYANQILRIEVLNKSMNLGVTVKKRGPTQVMTGQEIKYDFAQVSNDSNVPLESFYWRDVLPTDAARLTKIITSTWNANLRYKIVYKTNYKEDYQTLADNLDTSVSRTINASAASLGLSSGEYVTEVMFAFGTVPVGFRNKSTPQIFCKVLTDIPHEYEFANKTDVGGVYSGNWIMAQDRWVSSVWNPNYKPPKLPKTGY